MHCYTYRVICITYPQFWHSWVMRPPQARGGRSLVTWWRGGVQSLSCFIPDFTQGTHTGTSGFYFNLLLWQSSVLTLVSGFFTLPFFFTPTTVSSMKVKRGKVTGATSTKRTSVAKRRRRPVKMVSQRGTNRMPRSRRPTAGRREGLAPLSPMRRLHCFFYYIPREAERTLASYWSMSWQLEPTGCTCS